MKVLKKSTSSKGKSIELAHTIRKEIHSGKIPTGMKFETISKVAASYNVAVATISKVFNMLENEGLIERINGVGVYVKQKTKRRFALVFDSAAEQGVFSHKSVFMKYFIEKCVASDMEYTVFENIDNDKDCYKLQKLLKHNAYDVVLISSLHFAKFSEKYLKGIPILPIGLYPYKWLKCCISFDPNFISKAGMLLKSMGCKKVGLISRPNHRKEWCSEDILSDAEHYKLLIDKDGKIFNKKLLKYAELSPRESYEKTNELLKENKDVDKIGIISVDAVLTHGIMSAVLQSGNLLWEKVFIVSHAINECPLADFPIPVITFNASIKKEITLLWELVEQYFKSDVMPVGNHFLSQECSKIIK